MAPVITRSMFEDSNLLEEVVCCVVNLDVDAVVVTEEERTMQDDLVCLVKKHLDRFKAHKMK